MINQFDQDYENFKDNLPVDLTNEEYEEEIKKWLEKKEKNERVVSAS